MSGSFKFINFEIPAEAKIEEEKVEEIPKIHSIPVRIEYDGEAKVSDYFQIKTHVNEKKASSEVKSESESTDKTKADTFYSASFRGTPFVGKTVSIPSGFQGYTLEKVEPPSSLDFRKEMMGAAARSAESEYSEDIALLEPLVPESYLKLQSMSTGVAPVFKEFVRWNIGLPENGYQDELIDETMSYMGMSDAIHS